MNLNQYVQDAVRTESKIDKISLTENNNLDPSYFLYALRLFIAAGNVLDCYKKNIFYGKDVEGDVLLHLRGIDYIQYQHNNTEEEIDIDPRVFHALVGAATEATELMEALLSTINGEDVDYVNVMEEFGDINWYEAIGCDATGVSFEQILTTNIEKLRKRFPEKFTNENAINRNLKEERNTLEEGLQNP